MVMDYHLESCRKMKLSLFPRYNCATHCHDDYCLGMSYNCWYFCLESSIELNMKRNKPNYRCILLLPLNGKPETHVWRAGGAELYLDVKAERKMIQTQYPA